MHARSYSGESAPFPELIGSLRRAYQIFGRKHLAFLSSLHVLAIAASTAFLLYFILSTTAGAGTFQVPGSLSVDGVGQATYSIPIEIPPGTAGWVPHISLNYQSRGGDGPLGMGWSIGGLSKITRCPQTYAQDNSAQHPVIGVGVVNNNTTDRLCLDGQRLMVVNGQSYGTSGAIYGDGRGCRRGRRGRPWRASPWPQRRIRYGRNCNASWGSDGCLPANGRFSSVL